MANLSEDLLICSAVLISLDGFPAASEDENFTVDVGELSFREIYLSMASQI